MDDVTYIDLDLDCKCIKLSFKSKKDRQNTSSIFQKNINLYVIVVYDIMSKPVYLRSTSGISIPFSVW